VTGYTAAGLPYPTPQDAVCNTDKALRDLAAAAKTRIANAALVAFRGVIGTDGNGDAAVSVPALASMTVVGAWAYSIQYAPGGTAPVPLVCSIVGMSGATTVVTRWTTVPTSGGYTARPWANNALDCAMIVWGTPK